MEENYSLFQRLKKLDHSDEYPFHMPGHKRNDKAEIPGGMASFDITEIEGFDNLHHARGILKEAMENAARIYHSEKTYFLVNGSSCGILAAISAVINEGDTLILGRNAHTSAYRGAYLRGARIKSLFPEMISGYDLYGMIDPQEVKRLLEETPQAKAVMLTSPTYDGFVSDIRQIADIVHSYDKILIVDEAHGAHFGLDKRLPESSVSCGADLVIQSLHKTLPSLTQTALLHVNGDRVDRERVERFLKIYQTSSPSYLLMGSMDHCIRQMQAHGTEWFQEFFDCRNAFMAKTNGLCHLKVLDSMPGTGQAYILDPCKIVILTHGTGYTGVQLQKLLLEKYHLQMEMAGPYYVVAIITVMDTREGFERLSEALCEIDILCGKQEHEQQGLADEQLLEQVIMERKKYPARYSMKEVMDTDKSMLRSVPFAKSRDHISAEAVYVYPPGIPVILPGENITEKVISLINTYREKGMSVQGLSDETGATIRCMK